MSKFFIQRCRATFNASDSQKILARNVEFQGFITIFQKLAFLDRVSNVLVNLLDVQGSQRKVCRSIEKCWFYNSVKKFRAKRFILTILRCKNLQKRRFQNAPPPYTPYSASEFHGDKKFFMPSKIKFLCQAKKATK